MNAGELILRQSKLLLENKQRAITMAVLFSVMPFVAWLSVSIVALVTLRKGAKHGFEVMLPAFVIHSVPLMMLVPWDSAFINTAVAFVPCYLGAVVLRRTTSLQMVAGVFLLQAYLGYLLIQVLFPDFIASQFEQIKTLFSEYSSYDGIFSNTDGFGARELSELFFGFQILGAIISCSISLIFARSIQSKLFVPGGFARELSSFRGGKLSLLMLVPVSLAAYYSWPIGLCLLPAVLAYYFVSGFNLMYSILAKKQQLKIMILLCLIILVKPAFVIVAYITLGALDSIFNFRLYLPSVMRDSI